ncbi:hypothetical protein [Bartonella machadoae]|uniref:hypothetical protein n=1 Tax=Bartonella machadoae TaxID=2893471 RepID=UPI001F4CB882|nr:hypothetical protein [Bartonella machadoae]UNE53945.1 hypothetical protein LNM86_10230 [Bartonella machadoae]
MKLFSITHAVTFIIFVSIPILLGCTKVDSLDKYDKLYEKYVRENYTESEYLERLKMTKLLMDDFYKNIKRTIPMPHDYSHFWRYLITLPSNPPKFDILRHYHIVLVFCGRFADLWQGDKSMPTLTFNDLKTELENFRIRKAQYYDSLHTLHNRFFQAKFETYFNDPMFEYAKKFLDSPNGISRKEQTIRTEKMILDNEIIRFKNTARVCDLARNVYIRMLPQRSVRPPVRYSYFEKWKQYLTNF